jgi:hypothetical protein
MKLHNFCLDSHCAAPTQIFVEDLRDSDAWVLHDNTRDDDVLHRVRATGDQRRVITDNIWTLGILCPAHASMNSRCLMVF